MIRFLLAASLAGTAHAAPGCPVPADLPPPHAETASVDQPGRVEPIGGYTLALIWTPHHCVRAVPGAESFECGAETGKGFVLHGLWPDGRGASWPQWCAATAILPRRTIAAHFCATPSPQLMQHEWAKHGTCMRVTPEAYFRRSNRLFLALRFPDMTSLASGSLTNIGFAAAFAAANPGLQPDRIRLNQDGEGWLREVWICLDRRFRYRTCSGPLPAERPVRIRLPR